MRNIIIIIGKNIETVVGDESLRVDVEEEGQSSDWVKVDADDIKDDVDELTDEQKAWVADDWLKLGGGKSKKKRQEMAIAAYLDAKENKK